MAVKRKNNYLEPSIEIILIDGDDIITSSNTGDAPFIGEDDEFNINAGTL